MGSRRLALVELSFELGVRASVAEVLGSVPGSMPLSCVCVESVRASSSEFVGVVESVRASANEFAEESAADVSSSVTGSVSLSGSEVMVS